MPLPLVPLAIGVGGSLAGSVLGSLIERMFKGEYDPAKDRAALKSERQKRIYDRVNKGASLTQATAEVDDEIEAHIAEKERAHAGDGSTGAMIGGVAGGLGGGLIASGLKKASTTVVGKAAEAAPRLGFTPKPPPAVSAPPRLGMSEPLPSAGPIKTGTDNFGMKSGAPIDAEFSPIPKGAGQRPPNAFMTRENAAMPFDEPSAQSRGFTMVGEPARLTGPSEKEMSIATQAALRALRQAGYGGD